MKTVLITGGAGFIGSNFISLFIDNNKNTKVVNLDNLTYAGDLSNLTEVEKNRRYSFVDGVIYNDPDLNIDWILKEEEIVVSEKDEKLKKIKEFLGELFTNG